MKNNNSEHTRQRTLKHQIMRCLGFGAQRSSARPEKRNSHPRRSEAGNVFFTLFGAVAVVGVLGAGIMSTMRGPLSTMVEVNRIEESKAQLRLNARLILLDAGNQSPGYCGDADDDTASSGSVEFTEPKGHVTGVGAPTGGGFMPSIGGTITDPWGQTYGYCAYNNGADNSTSCGSENYLAGGTSLNDIAIILISGGPDRSISTTCLQGASNNPQGDDLMEALTYTEAVSGSGGLWTDTGTSIDTGKAINVTDTTNDSAFGAGATFGGDVTLGAGTSVTAPSVTTDIIAGLTGGSVELNANVTVSGTNTTLLQGATTIDDTLNVTGAGDFDTTLNVDGATTLAGTTVTTLRATGAVDFDTTLNVDGSISNVGGNLTLNDAVDITGALDVTGATDITGDFSVNTNMFTVDAANGDTVIAGTTDLNGKTIIRGDGNTSGTDAFEIWNSDPTPLELLSVNDVGDVTINTRGADGTTDALTIENNETTTTLLNLNDAGDLQIAGALDLGTGLTINGATDAGKMLVGAVTTGIFTAVDMSGDATIDNTGLLTIANDAITTSKISNAGGSDNQCLRLDGTNVVWEDCTAGGGGDGVGSGTLAQLLANGNSADDTAPIDTKIINLADPTDAQDAATKNYVDTALAGVSSDRIQDGGTPDTYIDVDTSVTTDGTPNSIVFFNNGTQSMELQADGDLAVDTDTLFVDTTNGRVGIGTASPGINLHIEDAGIPGIMLSDTASSSTAGIALSANNFTIFDTAFGNTQLFNANLINHNIGIGTGSTIEASALLELSTTTQGFLPPRLDTAEITTLTALPPATGLLIFNEDAGDAGLLQFWDGTQWVDVGGGGVTNDDILWQPNGTNDYIEYADTLGGVRIGRVTGQPAPATDWLLDVTNSVVYTTTNKVGINSSTISGGLELDVTGNIGATQYCNDSGGACFTAADIAALSGGGGYDWDSLVNAMTLDATTTIDMDINNADINFDDDTLFIDSSANSVGIGTAVPSSALDIVNNVLPSTTPLVRISSTGSNQELLRLRRASNWIGFNSGTSGVFRLEYGDGIMRFDTANDDINFDNQVSIGTTDPDVSASLDITSTTRGFLGPRMDNTQRDAITTPATGLLIFSTTDNVFQFNSGTPGAPVWSNVGAGGSSGALNDLTDVNTAGAGNGSVIKFDGANWVVGNDVTGLEDFSGNLTFTGSILTPGAWSQVGNGYTISVPSSRHLELTSLDTSTVVTLDDSNGELQTYAWDGTNWSTQGSAFSLSVNSGFGISALNSSTVAVTSGNTLRTYSFNGSTWSQVGNTLTLPGAGIIQGQPMSALDSSNVVILTTDNNLRAYSWDGTDWSINGNALSVTDGFRDVVSALNSTTIALVTEGNLRTYSFDGTNWSSVGNALAASGTGSGGATITTMNATTVVIGVYNGDTRIYQFDGTDWSVAGTLIDIAGFGIVSITALDPSNSTIATFSNDTLDELRVYQNGGAVTPNTIEDSDNNGILAGLINDGAQFIVSGSANNDGTFTKITTIDADTVEVSQSVSDEGPVSATISILGDLWNTDGTNVFRSGGDVGIGTNTPNLNTFDRALTVSSASTADSMAGIEIQGNQTSDATIGAITFNNGSNLTAAIESNRSGANTDGNLKFYTSSGGTPAERMRIHSTGRVGIGAFPPNVSAMLDVASTTSGFLGPRMDNTQRDAITTPATGLLIFSTTDNVFQFNSGTPGAPVWTSFSTSAGSATKAEDADGDTWVRTEDDSNADNDTIRFAAGAGAEHMRITSTGNVGIGNTTPSSALDVTGDIEVSNYVKFNGVAGDAPTYTAPSLALDGLSDVSAPTPSTNDVLTWNGSSWVSAAAASGGGGGAIDDLSDATTDYTTDFNMFMGDSAGASIAGGGQYNLAIGQNAATALTTGDDNVAIGYDALAAVTDQASIVAIGRGAGRQFAGNSAGIASTFIGNYAGETAGNSLNAGIVAIGSNALRYSGSTNYVGGTTVIGSAALENSGQNGSAEDNTVIGTVAGIYQREGNDNVYIGAGAASGGNSYSHTGDNNVYIGSDAATGLDGATNNNVIIGQGTAATFDAGDNNIIIGQGVDVSGATVSNELNIGNTIYGDLSNDYVGIGNASPSVALDVTGDIEYSGVITDVSDIRLKTNINPLNADDMINRIAKVDTYTFAMKDDKNGRIEYGVMAQEIEKIFPELVRTADDEMQTKSVNYTGLIAPMIEATKSLKSENDSLKAEIAEIKSAQADILEEVKGLSRHTGYGLEKANVQMLALMLLMMMLSGGIGALLIQRRNTNKS